MKNKLLKTSAIALAFVGIVTQPASVFAANNNYGIDYSGGVHLGTDHTVDNVNYAPDMIGELEFLVGSGVPDSITFSPGNWERAYMKEADNSCSSVNYVKIYDGASIDPNLWFTLKKGNYSQTVKLVDFGLNDVVTSETNALALAVPYYGTIQSGMHLYADSECTTQISDIRDLNAGNDGQAFYETNITLSREGVSDFTSNSLYFEISDIDNAQSFKIMNAESQLIKDNMFAIDYDALQPNYKGDWAADPRYNMYVGKDLSGDGIPYIYSPFPKMVASPDTSNIYVKLAPSTQREGLELIVGFASGAGSRLSYFAKQFTVEYNSDEHGVITGLENEIVISGDNPAGSSSRPNDGYEFEYWIADKNVTLTDGTTIPAGQAITAEQVKMVVVNEDLTFTAVHATIPEEESSDTLAPNTGHSTGSMNAAVISVSVIGVALGALALAMIPKFAHRKIGFKK